VKVLIADPLSDEGLAVLRDEQDIEYDVKTKRSEEEILKDIHEYDAVIVRSETKITAAIIDAGKNLKVIGRAGVGLDNVDVPAATRRGIIVMNVPGGNTISTAEHTMSLLLSMNRNIPQAFNAMKDPNTKVDRKKFTGAELNHKKLGVIGLGRIGMEVSKRAEAFGMEILGYDPYCSAEKAESAGIRLCDLETIYKESDYITVHVPMTKETKGLIGAKEFAMMKKGVRVVNCARGGIYEEGALFDALKSGQVAAAAFDVFESEPPSPNHPLMTLSNFICTPHLGAATAEAQVQVAVDMAHQIIDALKGRMVRNACNIPAMDPEVLTRISPYLSLAEKLGRFAAQIVEGRVEEMHIRYCGDVATYHVAPISIAVLKGFLEPVLQDSINFVNAPYIAKERGIRVVESKSSETEDYATLISLHVKVNGVERIVAGTLFGKHDCRIVRIDEYRLDCIPSGYILVVKNVDVPGIIGNIGSYLAKQEINIAGMALGRLEKGGQALTALNIDESLTKSQLDELRGYPNITDARVVDLD